MLKVSNLSVRYGELTVVKDVSLSVRQGSIVALVGANGAGKSSIINAISGVAECRSGSIEFMGQNIGDLMPHERVALGLVQVPEGRLLFGSMSVMDNLQLGAYLPNARKKREASLDTVFSLFPRLLDRKEQIAKTLSGGEQQMLAIGRGLMATPRLLILDEPSWGLAPKLVSEVLAAIERINADGMTVLLVEQHVQQCLGIADYAYVLENGSIVLEGAGEEILGNTYVKQAYLGL